MLLQMRLLREVLEAELTLIRSLAEVDLLMAKQIRLSAEELVAFAAIESRAFAFLTRPTTSSSSRLSLGFFPAFSGVHVGGRGSSGGHFRRGGKGFLLMVMLLLLLLSLLLMRRLRLDLLVLELLLLMMLLLLLLLLLYVNGLHFLATLRGG